MNPTVKMESPNTPVTDRRRSLLMTAAGHMLRESGRTDDAEAAYRDALESSPNNAKAYQSLGNVLIEQGKEDEALTAYGEAGRLQPFPRHISDLLVRVLHLKGRSEEARDLLENWVASDPADPIGRHLLAAAGNGDAPDRASDEYLKETFDGFARSFDEVLERLEYRGPQLVAEAAGAAIGEPNGDLDVLDAGCGTGLGGPLLAPYARHLTGVDLSAGMLERAKERDVYDELIEAELTEYLSGHDQRFDLIGSADVLIYFGEVGGLMASAYGALRPGGRIVFTVEAAPEFDAPHGFRLEKHGRYSHSRPYLEQIAAETGFTAAAITDAVLRREAQEPVAGLVVTLEKMV